MGRSRRPARGDVDGRSNGDGGSDAYRRALDECARVAREESVRAEAALEETERLWRWLKGAIDEIAGRGSSDSVVIQDPGTRLRELATTLDVGLSHALAAARASLKSKHGALDRFTVTLFGRTMAGKSTIREALTQGDGSSIGQGAQRTTRDVREYTWQSLRIVDTPGIGAYEGDEDRALALSVIDETDIVLFLVSSDSIQEEAFRAMQTLREQNKPILFVLNVKRDLEKPVYMRRFLKNRSSVFDDDELRGHIGRIQRLAGEILGMREVRVVPVHAQAAYLATLPKYREQSEQLARSCGLDDLLQALKDDILQRGRVRRVQTLLDGTIVSLIAFRHGLADQAKTVDHGAAYIRDKFDELDVWLKGFVRHTKARTKTESANLVKPLRASVSTFVDDNIERKDVAARWRRKVRALKIEEWLRGQQDMILDELRGRLDDFTREMAVEVKLVGDFEVASPSQANPWDVKRSLGWLSAGAGALAGVAAVGGFIFAANFWNPVGWFAGVVSVASLGLSWLFGDRERKLQRQKAAAARQLRGSIDELEQKVADALHEWFSTEVNGRLVRGIRADTTQLYSRMFEVGRVLRDGADKVGMLVEDLDRRLLVRTGQFVGVALARERLARVVRDPGVRTKLLWNDDVDDPRFREQVGAALGEWIDGVREGPLADKVAAALRPASVAPAAVAVSGRAATVRLPKAEVDLALGPGGINLSLASRLLGIEMTVVCEEPQEHD